MQYFATGAIMKCNKLFLLIRESVMQLVSEALKHPVKQTVEENFEEKVLSSC